MAPCWDRKAAVCEFMTLAHPQTTGFLRLRTSSTSTLPLSSGHLRPAARRMADGPSGYEQRGCFVRDPCLRGDFVAVLLGWSADLPPLALRHPNKFTLLRIITALYY
jgi:hypothetical protein